MAFSIQISKQCDFFFNFKPKLYAQKILGLLDVTSGEFEFNFVDDAAIVDLNQRYLQGDYSTDIITFNLGSTEHILGDVYICVDQARRQAQELGHSLTDELKTLIVHGILHLLGHEDYTDDQRKKMHAYQDELIEKAK